MGKVEGGIAFFWRLVVPVRIDSMDVSDQELAKVMLMGVKKIVDDRLAALDPKDGVERVELRYAVNQEVRSDDPLERLARDRGMTAGNGLPVAPQKGFAVVLDEFGPNPPADLRTRKGRAWKKARAGATT